MKITNPHDHAVSIPNVADVAAGETVDIPDPIASSLVEQGWTVPKPPRSRKATPSEESD